MREAPIARTARLAVVGFWASFASMVFFAFGALNPYLSAAQAPFKTGIEVVSLSVTVSDRSGEPVSDLKVEDFDIREDGAPQKVTYFSPGGDVSEVPLHIGLLFDTSESMERDLSFSRGAAIKFLGMFPRALDFTLVDFDTEVRSARFSQAEFPRLVARIRNRPAKGNTALYDALSIYLGGAFDQAGRKVLLLYTDGGDTTSSRSWPEAVRILRASDVTVYSIGFMANQRASDRVQQQSRLTEMAHLTGGAAFFPSVMKELDTMYARIADEVQAQYTVGYISTNSARNGTWRKVNVRVVRPGARLAVRTREGYFAPSK
jgi:Ca-activated chloride channel family protein